MIFLPKSLIFFRIVCYNQIHQRKGDNGLRSMTGFGRAAAEKDGRKMTVELKSVNHRFLDINIRIPRTLGFAEEQIRKTIQKRLTRGRVDVFVNYSALGEGAKQATADVGLIRSILDAARTAAKQTGLEDDLVLSHIVRLPDTILVEESADDEQAQAQLLQEALGQALSALVDMREREGKALHQNIMDCLGDIEKTSAVFAQRKETVVSEYAEKLKARLETLLSGSEIDETRFNAEIAYIADKSDITEEIVRLGTHVAQFRKAAAGAAAVGRKLDFMVQEMNRELNTIGSKSQDMQITNAVIDAKSQVEKIREQVQNIE